MGLLRIAICDDSELELTIIKNYIMHLLNGYDDEYIFKTFTNSDDFFESKTFFDLLLLDVEMEKINGIKVKERMELVGIDSKIIFVSNYQDKMIEAFGKNVYAYVNKKDLSSLDYVLKKFLNDWQDNETIIVDNENIRMKNILYLKGEGAYTNIILSDKKIMERKYLKDYETELLNFGFCRVHKSYLINFRYMKSISYSHIVLLDGTHIRISRGLYTHIKSDHYQYIKRKLSWK